MLNTANKFYFLVFFSLATVLFASGFAKQIDKSSKVSPQIVNDADRNKVESILDQKKLHETLLSRSERSTMKAAQSWSPRPDFVRPEKQAIERSDNDRIKNALHRATVWKKFGRNAVTANRSFRVRSSAAAPVVLINGAAAASVAAGETFTVKITLTDSALVDIFLDVNGDSVVDSGDLSILDIIMPFEDARDQGSFHVFDNSPEDKDATVGVFEVDVDDFPYAGMPVILQATDAGGTGSAFLNIGPLQGSVSVNGTVTTGNSNPAMLLIGADDEDDMIITFTEADGSFDLGVNAHKDEIIIGAADAFLSMVTGQFLAKFSIPFFSNSTENISLNIERDAAVMGMIQDKNSAGLANVQVGAGAFNMLEMVIAFSATSSTGNYILPLQSGFEYGLGAMHPDYMGGNCMTMPLKPSAGDTITLNCQLEPWPAFVEGTVTDFNTSEKLRDIEIELAMGPADTSYNDDSEGGFFMGNDFWRYTWTDSEGFYRLGSKYGTGGLCAFDWDTQKYQDFCVHPFVVDQPLVTENITLTPWDGLIYGTVTDSISGAPVADVDVYLTWDNMSDSTYYFSPFHWTMTDEDGNYQIPAMNGSYAICATNWDMNYSETCDSVTVLNDSVQVDLQIVPPDGMIYGYVTDAGSGDSLGGVSVDIFMSDGDNYYTETNDEGYFALGVNNGTYEICFYDWKMSYMDSCITDITVADDSVKVNVSLDKFIFDGAISGTVKDDNNDPVVALVIALDTSKVYFANAERMTITHSDGSYFLPVMNGSYVAAAIPLNETLFPAYAGDIVVNFDTVVVNFVVTEPVVDAVVYGYVTDSSGTLIEGAEIIVSTDEKDMMFMGFTAYTESDADGYYSVDVVGFDDLTYWVYGESFGADSSEYIMDYVDGIAVHSGDSINVDLELGFHDNWSGDDSAENKHGNFRFGWGAHGGVMDGEWPAGSGTYYLAEGGLAVMAFGNMNADTLLAGFASIDEDTSEWDNNGGWDAMTGVMHGYEDPNMYRGMDYKESMGYGIEVGEIIISPDSTDFVLIGTQITNAGAHTLNDLYAGYVLDWDVAMSDSHDSYDDDFTGSMTIMVSHPVLAVMVPVKISYMLDDDGDAGKSPGIVAMATLAEMGNTATHVSLDISVSDPESAEEIVDIMMTETDSPDATTASDYVTGQFISAGDLEPGDSLSFATVLMAANDTSEFKDILDDALNLLIGELLAIEDETDVLPSEFSLSQNYPNPFNPVTQIQYMLPQGSNVNLSIYNILGQEVITLVNRFEDPGFKQVTWNGKNSSGQMMGGGVYIYRIQAGEYTSTMKMLLLK